MACKASVLATFSREKNMRLPAKPGLAMAAILAASLGFAGSTRAAPLAGVAAAVPAVQITRAPSAAEALPEKAYHKGYAHHPHGYKHRHYYKPIYKRHHHHYGYKKPPS
jgi:hypothetical protein